MKKILLPLIILAIISFVGYKWLRSQSDAQDEEIANHEIELAQDQLKNNR